VLGIETEFKDLRGGGVLFLPQRVAVVGQGSTASTYATTKRQVTSANEVATLYGFGSPLHLACRQLFPLNGDGVGTIPVTVYPMEDSGTGVASSGDITPTVAPTEAGSFLVRINNIDSESFVIPATGATVATVVTQMTAAINAVLEMPVIATDSTTVCDLESKWKGTSANDIVVEVIGPTTIGVSFAITQPVGGLVNPTVDASLAQIGNVWETMIVNCLDIADATAIAAYSTFGDGRWGALVRKPLIVFTGNTEAVVATAVTVPDARTTDKTNCQLVAPGSNDLPFVVAARQVARIAVVANNNPPQDYGSQDATGLTPGTDGEQWTYPQRDLAVKAGSSTVEVKDGVINISDVVTFYHPSGDPLPAYRFVVDIVKLQNIIFNLDIEFSKTEWDGAPLIPDNQPTINATAKKPKMAKAAAAAILDSLGLNAIISDPETAKANIQAEIDPQNPKRLNMVITVQLAGNTNTISIDLEFGFFFGTATAVA
jgi:phage tail sheath gpL-like